MNRNLLLGVLFAWISIVQAQLGADTALLRWTAIGSERTQRVKALQAWFAADSLMTVARVLGALPSTIASSGKGRQEQEALARLAQGQAIAAAGLSTEALRAFHQVQAQFKAIDDAHGEHLCELAIGRLMAGLGRFDQALQHLFLARSGFVTDRDTTSLLVALQNLAYTSHMLNNSGQAMDHYREALRLTEGRGRSAFGMLIRLSEIENGLGHTEQADAWMDSARALVQNDPAVDDEHALEMWHGDNLLSRGDCDEALELLSIGLEANRHRSDKRSGVSWVLSAIARAHMCKKQYHKAVERAREGLAIAEEYGLVKEMMDNLEVLSSAYDTLGDARQALYYYKKYDVWWDSTRNAELTAAMTSSELDYTFDKEQFADSIVVATERTQERALAEQGLARERVRRNVLLGFGAFAMVFAVVDHRRRRRIKMEHARSEALLLNILPVEVAEELKAKGSAEAVHIDQVTVLFTDFKGFTAMSEVVTPQELVRDLNECFSAFDHITAKFGIEKIKTIGDAYMAAGGLPTPNTTHAVDVIQAAFEMRDFIAEGKARKIAEGLPYFEIRIGIHTGPVVAGIVGVKKFQYDIWGDTVNTASRMESSGEVGQVNISEATYALVKEQAGSLFDFTPRGKVQAKGKGELEMFFVRRSSEGA